ncbi:MAG: hypothetical protein EXR86_16320 [Gammaproteobacteria bacterium]|nr:hypothetical protein [Gammaproteobacteria bacterium]
MRLAWIFSVALASVSVAVVADDFERLREAVARAEYAESLPALAAAADQNDPRALTLLGSLYQQGQGVERDPVKAAELYTRAAELGDAEAQFNLGNIYLLGEGVKADEAWALTFYRQAAAQGHELAARNLEELYRASGLEPPAPTIKPPTAPGPGDLARVQSEPAVAAAAPIAQEPLAPTATPSSSPPVPGSVARMITAPLATPTDTHVPNTTPVGGIAAAVPTNTGSSADELRAIELARQHGVEIKIAPSSVSAANTNLMAATNNATVVATTLAGSVDPGSPATVAQPADSRDEQSTAPAAVTADFGPGTNTRSARRPAASEFTQTTNALAVPNESSTTVPTQEQRNDAASHYELAQRYLRGDGVPRNPTLALQWLHRAAQSGNADAEFDLAQHYLDGDEVPPDEAMAITLLREATLSGHKKARAQLQQIYADAGLPMPMLTRPQNHVAPATPAKIASTSTGESVNPADAPVANPASDGADAGREGSAQHE